MNSPNAPQPNVFVNLLKAILTGVITTSVLIGGLSSFGPIILVSIVCTLGIGLLIWIPLLWLFGRLTLAIFNFFDITNSTCHTQKKFRAVAKTVLFGCLGGAILTTPLGAILLVALVAETPIAAWVAWLLGFGLVGHFTPAVLKLLGVNLSNVTLEGSRSQAEEGDAITTIKLLTPQQKSLTNYIRKAQAKGFSESQIQSRLSQQGWSNTEITQAQAMVNAG